MDHLLYGVVSSAQGNVTETEFLKKPTFNRSFV